jgi:hypothetical protein
MHDWKKFSYCPWLTYQDLKSWYVTFQKKKLLYWNILDLKKKWKSEILTSPSARDSFSNSIAENRSELNRWVIDSAQIFELNRVPWAESIQLNELNWSSSFQFELNRFSSFQFELNRVSSWDSMTGPVKMSYEQFSLVFEQQQQQQQQRFEHTHWQPWDSF